MAAPEQGPGPGAITYWGQVRGLASPAAVADALAQRGLQPPERTYQQLLVLSAVVQRKYRCIRWSMGLAGVGIALVCWRSSSHSERGSGGCDG